MKKLKCAIHAGSPLRIFIFFGNEVRLHYTPKGIWQGIILTDISGIVFSGCISIRKRRVWRESILKLDIVVWIASKERRVLR